MIPIYFGGHADPLYEEACAGNTRHAEIIGIHFDPEEISYKRKRSFGLLMIVPRLTDKGMMWIRNTARRFLNR
nr:peptide-methionine (S)-S-oxide reductase [Bacteroidetes bacterium endosymbiont of Geopemphigus sp.]